MEDALRAETFADQDAPEMQERIGALEYQQSKVAVGAPRFPRQSVDYRQNRDDMVKKHNYRSTPPVAPPERIIQEIAAAEDQCELFAQRRFIGRIKIACLQLAQVDLYELDDQNCVRHREYVLRIFPA